MLPRGEDGRKARTAARGGGMSRRARPMYGPTT
jgi:hypothetical protein